MALRMLSVAALYRFAPFADPAALRPPLEALGRAHGIRGTILLAYEGINGTIAGTDAAIDAMLAHIRTLPGCGGIVPRLSLAPRQPFPRFKVRVKREIVTMGQPGVDPATTTGTRVAPRDWNALIAAPDVAVIDTRNGFESGLGSFAGAVLPGTASFRDFPAWWAANSARFAGKRVAMFCTGGIRCEKSTNWLLQQGVAHVLHLDGGILNYLETVPEPDSLWQGQCFVFDSRVSVGHGLRPGAHTVCHACRRPLREAHRDSPLYEASVSCPDCHGEHDDTDRDRFRERKRQIALAQARADRR